MKKNFTSTLVMLGLFGALAAWYILYEEQYRPKQKQAQDSEKKLISFSAEEVTELRIEKLKSPPSEGITTSNSNPVYETIEIKRNGKDWLILSPVQTQGDSVAINTLVSAMCDAKQERVVDENPNDLNIYGLKTPLIKVSLKKDANSPVQEINIGSNTPVAYSVYSKLSSTPQVFKSSRTLISSLEKDLFALRDKSVLKINRDELTEVEIENSKGTIILTRDTNSNQDSWTLSRENLPADSLEWSKTLTSLVELKATKVAAEKESRLEQFGLLKPLSKITFSLKDKTRVVLYLGKVQDSLFAKRSGLETIFEVDKSLEQKVVANAAQYRDKHLAKFDRYSISRIKIEKPSESLELNKKDNETWALPTDQALTIDSTQVDKLLTRLQDTQITKFLESSPKEAPSKQLIKVSLFENKNKAEKEVLNLTLSALAGNRILGVRNQTNFRFEISKEDFDKLNISKQSLLKQEEKNKETNKGSKKS